MAGEYLSQCSNPSTLHHLWGSSLLRVLHRPSTNLVHLSLIADEGSELALEGGNLLLELGRLGGLLLDLGGELLDLSSLVILLLVGLGQLLVAVCLLGGISLGLSLELLDHVG